MIIEFAQQEFLLTPERALIHQEEATAFIADLHLGKSAHFRKSGIAIPQNIPDTDIGSIRELVHRYALQKIYILGDLFHSAYNTEWSKFEQLMEELKEVDFILIKGNHDILPQNIYNNSKLTIQEEPYLWKGIELRHLPHSPNTDAPFNIAGHIHPGVIMKGKARATIKLPCFLVSNRQIILPAFGRFTGLFQDKERKSYSKYGILSEKLIKID